jgi:cytochrome P450
VIFLFFDFRIYGVELISVLDYNARRDPEGASVSLIVLSGEEHAMRRRVWDHGMGSESLSEYAELISKRGLQLVHELESIEGVVDISAWISYFS